MSVYVCICHSSYPESLRIKVGLSSTCFPYATAMPSTLPKAKQKIKKILLNVPMNYHTLHVRCTSKFSCQYWAVCKQFVVCNSSTMHAVWELICAPSNNTIKQRTSYNTVHTYCSTLYLQNISTGRYNPENSCRLDIPTYSQN